MRKLQISTILLGGILVAPFQTAVAQEVAYANESRPGYVIFFSNGPAHLTSVAGETIKMAAAMQTGLRASSASSVLLGTLPW